MSPRLLGAVALAIGLGGCSGPPPATPNPEPSATVTAPNATTDRPVLGAPRPFTAPRPTVYQTSQGLTVWLIEKHDLPIVSLQVVLPVGAADDPPGKGGLAHITAGMLDEGAGERDALTISSELNDLGVELSTSVSRDGSAIGLTVLRKHLDRAMAIFGDVIARPRFEASEWKRVTDLWITSLERRSDDPGSVAAVTRSAVLYGPDTPYGHPIQGQPDTARSVSVGDAKSFYAASWRPDQAHLVVGGDIDKAQLDALIEKHLGGWKKPAQPLLPHSAAPKPLERRPKLVVVDRPDAPQAVIAVCGPGVAAGDPDAPLLDLVNTALGGSFTSRLNQNLREDHSWTYGARSSFTEARGVGAFVAQASVFTKVTGPALSEMLREIDGLATGGLTEEELRKVRAQDLTDLIQTNERMSGLVNRLGDLAILGLAPDHDARASEQRQAATAPALAALAKAHLDTSEVSIVVVGPKSQVIPQLRTLGRGEPELWTDEGRPAE